VHTVFWFENLKERDHSDDLRVEGKIILKCILGKQDRKLTGCIRLRMGISGGLLWTRLRTFGFHKMRGIS